VGAAGSAKPTLLNLLPRLNDPPPGTVFVDGVDVRDLPLDAQAWSVLSLPNALAAHPSILGCAQANQLTAADGFSGFDFNEDRDGVWFEGTGHMATAYAWANQLPSAEFYRQELNRAQATPPFGDGFGIAAASHDAMSTGFGFKLFRRLHTGATAWQVFAQLGSNPYYELQNGTETIGLYRPSTSTFYLRNSNTSGFPDSSIPYGAPGDTPIVGDWDGNGTVTIGLYRASISTFSRRSPGWRTIRRPWMRSPRRRRQRRSSSY